MFVVKATAVLFKRSILELPHIQVLQIYLIYCLFFFILLFLGDQFSKYRAFKMYFHISSYKEFTSDK